MKPVPQEFIVSPVKRARSELAAFISGAKKELAIYDPKIADPRMIRLLEDQAAAGVNIRILGKLDSSDKLSHRNLQHAPPRSVHGSGRPARIPRKPEPARRRVGNTSGSWSYF